MSFLLDAALSGNLEGFQEGVKTAVSQAGRGAMEEMRDAGIARFRRSILDAGLGQGVANSWRGEIYPRGGSSLEPALFLYTRAPHIVRAHTGEVIRSKDGAYLAIPIPGSPAEDFPNPRGPDTKVDYANQRFGDRLFVIPAVPGRVAMIAVEGVGFTKTGRMSVRKKTKSGAWGKGAMTVPLFWLVPQVTLKPALDVQEDFRWLADRFAQTYNQQMAGALMRSGLTN